MHEDEFKNGRFSHFINAKRRIIYIPLDAENEQGMDIVFLLLMLEEVFLQRVASAEVLHEFDIFERVDEFHTKGLKSPYNSFEIDMMRLTL